MNSESFKQREYRQIRAIEYYARYLNLDTEEAALIWCTSCAKVWAKVWADQHTEEHDDGCNSKVRTK